MDLMRGSVALLSVGAVAVAAVSGWTTWKPRSAMTAARAAGEGPDAMNAPYGSLKRGRRPVGFQPPNTRDYTGGTFGPYVALSPTTRRTADGGRYWLCRDTRTGEVVELSLITLRRLRREAA